MRPAVVVGVLIGVTILSTPVSCLRRTSSLPTYFVCGNYTEFNPRGFIVSPPVSSREPSNINCTLEIKGDHSEMITIHFEEFAIELPGDSSNDAVTVCGGLSEPGSVSPCCVGAMLKISELGPPRGKTKEDSLRGGHSRPADSLAKGKVQQNFYCGRGHSVPQPFLSTGNGISIQFVSLGNLMPKGQNVTRKFKLSYLVSKSADSCNEHEFQCGGDHKCIPKDWHCNQKRECEDGSDEKDCPYSQAGGSIREHEVGRDYRPRHSCSDREHIPCGEDMLHCFSPRQHCNGVKDCANGYDELGCLPSTPAGNYILCQHFKGNKTECPLSIQYCYNRDTQTCDGTMACPRGEDEQGCDAQCPHLIPCGRRSAGDPCGFREEQRCNGHDDCRDGIDERHCIPSSCGPRQGSFLCNDGRCIAEERRCDRTIDCAGAEDEMYCIKNSVITAAIMGSLVCGILVVIAISCTCRLYALRLVSYQRQQNCGSSSSQDERFRRQSSISDSDLLRFDALQDLYCYYGFRDPPPPYSVAVAGDPPALPPPPGVPPSRRRRSRTHHSGRIYTRRSSATPGGQPTGGPEGTPSPADDAQSSPAAQAPTESAQVVLPVPHPAPPYSQATSCEHHVSSSTTNDVVPKASTNENPSPQTVDRGIGSDDRSLESSQRNARENLNTSADIGCSTSTGSLSQVARGTLTEIEFSVLPPSTPCGDAIAVGAEATSPMTDEQPLICDN